MFEPARIPRLAYHRTRGIDGVCQRARNADVLQTVGVGPEETEGAVAAIRRSTRLFLDVHIMIYNPFDYIERFVQAGADRITFHFEATDLFI